MDDVTSWATLSRLLDEALDLPPDARSAWLEGLGAEYDTLKPRLRSMFDKALVSGDESFLATLPRFAPPELDDGVLHLRSGRGGGMVGPYRLVRELASGGQGTVWLAERPDGLVNRPVAVKLPIGLAYRPDLAERLARERDILAGLTHPHIARLYDAGLTAEGEPYLALEYVDGSAIDRHCDSVGLSLTQRITLFLQVARAVAYAHGQLVVHRDLKPSNVLVTPEGEVRLLDFGIAKLLGTGEAGDSTLTEAGGRAMTLHYASPEQVSHAPLGIATDVYSLGVMLYELLTGTRPYRPARDTVAALEEAILSADPILPSEAAGAPDRRRAIRGDLDTILLKSLQKAPGDRYESATALADDLERYLAGRPVRARADSHWYRTRKFVARHRLGVMATAAVVLAVVGGAGVATWQALVARSEQRRAQAVNEFIVALLRDGNLDMEAATPMTVANLLERARERLKGFDPGEAKAELLLVVGEALLSLGNTATVAEVAAEALAEARPLGDDHPLVFRARVLGAWAHMYRGEPAEMRAELDAVAPALERNPVVYARELAIVARLRADAAIDAGQYEQAEAAAREAVRRADALGPRTLQGLQANGVLVEALRRTRKFDEAVAVADRGVGLAEELSGNAAKGAHVVRARALYARSLGDAGQLSVAATQIERVLADAEGLYGADGRTVAFHLHSLAGLQIRLGRLKDAVATANRALAIIEAHSTPESATLASFRNMVGAALLASRRADEALPPLSQARDTAARVFGPTHENTLATRATVAMALGLAGRRAETDRELDRLVTDMKALGRDVPRVLIAAGTVHRLQGANDLAVDTLQRAAKATDDGLELAQIRAQLGLARLSQGHLDEARTALEDARRVLTELGVEMSPGLADVLVGLGRVHLAQRRPSDALPLFEEAHRFWQGFGPSLSDARVAATWLARCRAALGLAVPGS